MENLFENQDIIDINIGPATKKGEELMQWIVKSVQDAVDTPLALDTKNISAIEAGLEVHKGTAMINSVTGDKDKLDVLMPLTKKYNAKIWVEDKIQGDYTKGSNFVILIPLA